jgi:CRP-like cAMP-binding protein
LSASLALPETNQLIAGLPPRERRRLLQLSEPVELAFGAVLCEADAPLRHAYFPLTSMISLSAVIPGHHPLGLAVIGNEGVLGATLVLGVHTERLRALVFGSGVALRLTAKLLRRELRDSPGLSSSLMRHSLELMGQLLQTAACNSFHEVEMRLARWLLMTDDRSNLARFRLTHQFLADLLGVQRGAVTIAAGRLQSRKIINYTRGQINILSRSGLEAASCECYVVQH